MTATIKGATTHTIAEAAALIQQGGLVALPTETVYGLGANALDGRAVARIFEAKGRPAFNPLIIHVEDLGQAQAYAQFNDMALAVASQFWPGPITLILPAKPDTKISALALAGLSTIAIRVPSHKVAQALIRQAGVPIAAPSANASGEPSTTTPHHVAASLGNKVDLILAAGPSTVGLESTVLDLSSDKPVILRPGAITAEDLAPFIGEVTYDFGSHDSPKSPGQLLKHYAPHSPVRLRAVDVAPDEALLAFGSLKFMGIRGGGFAKDLPDGQILNLSESGDLFEAAANLFAYLRELDQPRFSGIAVMDIPDTGLGIAINDRLKRAAQK